VLTRGARGATLGGDRDAFDGALDILRAGDTEEDFCCGSHLLAVLGVTVADVEQSDAG
jgi:hypothetical protein